jgi:predicted transcriptional regulator
MPRIILALRESGLTQTEIAVEVGCSPACIQKWLKAETRDGDMMVVRPSSSITVQKTEPALLGADDATTLPNTQ